MKKILIAEDNEFVRRSYSMMFRGTEHDVRIAGDPIEARRIMAEGFTPDLIISDWDMPRMNGGEFCQVLRAEDNETPFYIVSGDLRDHKSVGATDFYLKPLMPDDLEKIIGE